jgi:hypothetical protein
MSLGQQPTQSRLCTTKYICPNCPDKVELHSNTCPAKLRELSSSIGLQYRLHKDTTHLQSEPCLQISELCWKCTLEFNQYKIEQALHDAVAWRRRLKVFKQRRKGKGSPEREVGDVMGQTSSR